MLSHPPVLRGWQVPAQQRLQIGTTKRKKPSGITRMALKT
jgi:hypothetical protein